MLVSDLDLPEFDYFDPTLRGGRLHEVLKELGARHWVARLPFGWLVLERQVTIDLLRDPALAAPLRTLFELIGIRDEGWLRRRVNEALESTTGETLPRVSTIGIVRLLTLSHNEPKSGRGSSPASLERWRA